MFNKILSCAMEFVNEALRLEVAIQGFLFNRYCYLPGPTLGTEATKYLCPSTRLRKRAITDTIKTYDVMSGREETILPALFREREFGWDCYFRGGKVSPLRSHLRKRY